MTTGFTSDNRIPDRLAVRRKTAAQLLDCSLDHIDDLRERGLIETVRIGRRALIIYKSLEVLLQQHREDAYIDEEGA